MHPRTVYASLLAVGAVLHLALLVKMPSRGYLALYIFWLLISAGCVGLLSSRTSRQTEIPQNRSIRRVSQPQQSAPWVFWGIAAIGMAIHLFGPYEVTRLSRHKVLWSQSVAMTIMVVLCAAGSWGLVRGHQGDMAAPIPDGSVAVRIGEWFRRSVGFALAGWGGWMAVRGVRQWAQTPGGVDRMISFVFVVGGALLFLLGLAVALCAGRSTQ